MENFFNGFTGFFQRVGAGILALLQPLFWFIPGIWGGDLPLDSAPAAPRYADVSTTPNADGWYVVLDEDFSSGTLDSSVWMPSPHGLRNTEYWCPNAIEFRDGQCIINAYHTDDNVCPDGLCPASGDFTSGIETRGKLEQAFGYFEARVKFPKAEGMWTAMWLQSGTMSRAGNGGREGAELDVYESSFWSNPSTMGNCVHWDGYGTWHRDSGITYDAGVDLTEDYHVWGLLWTPDEYVFYLDGKPVRRTQAGGVSQTPEFLRLTTEIRHGEWGPYGQKLGEFSGTKAQPDQFFIDYVHIYQNKNFESKIKSPDDYREPLLARLIP
jgi:hypothetical protein